MEFHLCLNKAKVREMKMERKGGGSGSYTKVGTFLSVHE